MAEDSAPVANPIQLVISRQYPLPPLGIIQIPLHGFTDTGFKGFLGYPAQFALNFTGINRIANIMPWAIFNKGDEVFKALAASAGVSVLISTNE